MRGLRHVHENMNIIKTFHNPISYLIKDVAHFI